MTITKALGYAYRELISQPSRRLPFWILVGFLPTFVLARIIVATSPNLFLNVHGVHVHHFTYGIFILVVVGLTAILWSKATYAVRRILAIVYGIGLSLSFDEFGMWLHLTSQYGLDQSEDVMVGILVLLVILVYGVDLLRRMRTYVKSLERKGRK